MKGTNLKLQKSDSAPQKSRIQHGVSDEYSLRQSKATAWWWNFDAGTNIEVNVGVEVEANSGGVFVEADTRRGLGVGTPDYISQEARDTLSFPSIRELDLFIDALVAARKEAGRAGTIAGGAA